MPYSYYRTVTIDHTKVGGSNLTDYPVLIYGTYSYLATVGNGGKVTSASGYDIQFYSDAALTTTLKFERANWVDSSGFSEFYVKVPTVSSSVDTVIYMAYGNSSVTTDQSDSANTWDSNFKAVYHLGGPTFLSVVDSTSNGFTLTNSASALPARGTGQISGCANFVGFDTNLTNASITSTASMSFQFWSFVAAADVRASALFFYGSTIGLADRCSADGPWSDSVFHWDCGNAVGGGRVQIAYNSYLDTWTHVTLTFDDSSDLHSIFFNGSSVASATNSSSSSTGKTPITIGNSYDGVSSLWHKGHVDEFRISNVARSAGWILADYNNQNSPSTFYTLGAELTTGVSPSDTLNNWADALVTGYGVTKIAFTDSLTLSEAQRLFLGMKFAGETLTQTDSLAYNFLAPSTPLSVVIVDKIIRNGSINGNNLALRDGLGFSVGPSGPVFVAVSDLGTYLDDTNLGLGYGIAVFD